MKRKELLVTDLLIAAYVTDRKAIFPRCLLRDSISDFHLHRSFWEDFLELPSKRDFGLYVRKVFPLDYSEQKAIPFVLYDLHLVYSRNVSQ